MRSAESVAVVAGNFDLLWPRRFIAFVAGAFFAVLLLPTVIDPVLVHFEITPGRTVVFYLTLCTVILAVARGVLSRDNTVFEPEVLLKEVVSHTHYMPGDWEGKLHSRMVSMTSSQLFVDLEISEAFCPPFRFTRPSARSSR